MAAYGGKYFGDVVRDEVGVDILKYHGYGMMVVVLVLSFVVYMGSSLLCSQFSYRTFKNHQLMEYWWTWIPMGLLGALWCPSMLNLYHMDDTQKPQWTFKAVASQWYWSYEFSLNGGESFEFESYMSADAGYSAGSGYRLLDVDWRMVAPTNTQITIYVTSTDVLHSFSLPGALLKVDAIPGRINQLPVKVTQCCVMYGQCSEICGVNHSFMPIVIEFIPPNVFVQYADAVGN